MHYGMQVLRRKHSGSISSMDELSTELMFFGGSGAVFPVSQECAMHGRAPRRKRQPALERRPVDAVVPAKAGTTSSANAYLSSTMRSMRRSGSAAPHSSWSPTV